MRHTIERSSLNTDLIAFGERNKLRPTRLEVLGPTKGVESDFWLEDGLLLSGIDLDLDGKRGRYISEPLMSGKFVSFHAIDGTHTQRPHNGLVHPMTFNSWSTGEQRSQYHNAIACGLIYGQFR